MTQPTEQSAETVGKVIAVENHGTIVAVHLLTDEKRLVPIYFDHRPFDWMLDAEGCGPEDLVGRRASYDGTSIKFLD